MDLYPSYRYHRDLGSRRVESPADVEALGEGWHDHPDLCLTEAERAAKRALEAPAPPPPDSFAQTPQGYVPQPFPSYRYRRMADGTVESMRVASAEAAALLGPEWTDHPDAPAAPAPAAPVAPAALSPVPPQGDEPEPQHGMTVAELAPLVAEADGDRLLEMQAIEARNPKGPRKGLLSAIAARLAE